MSVDENKASAVASDTVVTLTYTLRTLEGETVDEATSAEPLTYVHGYAQIVPGLEKNLEGLKSGEKKSFEVEPGDAFGERDDEAVFEVEKTEFPAGETVEAGDEFVAEGPDGEPLQMRIVEVLAESYVVDANHPLAGKRLRFEVEVGDVRAATEEEITEAQSDLEERAHEHGPACDHDHDHDHDHNGHSHDHEHGDAKGLVQLGKKSEKGSAT